MRKNWLIHKFKKAAPISFHKIYLIPRITCEGERHSSHGDSKEMGALVPFPMCSSFHAFKEECYTRWILMPGQFVHQRHSSGIHFSFTNDTFREWNSRRLPWSAFIYSVPAVGKIWIPGVQAKFWNPEGLHRIPRRCPPLPGSQAWQGMAGNCPGLWIPAWFTICG